MNRRKKAGGRRRSSEKRRRGRHEDRKDGERRDRRRRRRSRSESSESSGSSSSSDDIDSEDDADKIGLIKINAGEYIRDRFKVLGIAGQGTFGTVLECTDSKYDNEKVALKVVRSVKKYLDAAIEEVSILEKIRKQETETHAIS